MTKSTLLSEDYIMRLINQALAVFMQALGLKQAGQYDQSLQSYDQAMETLLGLRVSLVEQLEDSQLLAMLSFQDRLDVDRVLVLADIYRERGEVYALQGHLEQAQLSNQRSLYLYLEAALATESTPPLELVQKIEAQRASLSPQHLPIETRLALLDYLERVLASDGEFMAAAGLSRTDLQAAFSALDTLDPH